MKMHRKIAFDRYVGRPCAMVLNALVVILGQILNRDHADQPSVVSRIVVGKVVGMGSIMKATPLLRALRQRYPQAQLCVLTNRAHKPLVERIAQVDCGIYLRLDSAAGLMVSTLAALYEMNRKPVDLYFDLEVYSAFSSVIATCSRARNRYGFYRESTWFRFGLHTHLVFFNDTRPISSIYLKLGEACGAAGSAEPEPITIRAEDEQARKTYLQSIGLESGARYVIVNPNASEFMLERRWPLPYFAKLIETIVREFELPVVLVGSPAEREHNQTLLGLIDTSCSNMVFDSAGNISLPGVFALLAQSTLFVTNDSGLFHCARACQVPCVSLWGPGTSDHYGGIAGDRNLFVDNPAVYCRPCIYKIDVPPCHGNNICMKSIPPSRVMRKVSRMLGESTERDWYEIDAGVVNEQHQELDITLRRPQGGE